MKTPNLQQITDAIGEVKDEHLRGWDWPQEFTDEDGDHCLILGPWDLDDLPDETSRAEARAYEKKVRALFFRADQHAEEARHYLHLGHLGEAYEALQEAARLEEETGMNWFRRPLAMLGLVLAASDDIELDLRSVDLAWERHPDATAMEGGAIWGPGSPHEYEWFNPGHALQLVLQDLPREFWDHAMTMASVDQDLQEQV